jgi:flagellar export protein FliJ
MTRRKIKKVLELKGFTKEQLEISFQKSKEALEIENSKLDFLAKTFERTAVEFNRKQKEGLIISQELDFFYNYFSYLNKQIDQQQQTVSLRLTEVEQIQKILTKAHKEKRLFEIFHDKILHEEIRKTVKDEQKEVDFYFISRKSRR